MTHVRRLAVVLRSLSKASLSVPIRKIMTTDNYSLSCYVFHQSVDRELPRRIDRQRSSLWPRKSREPLDFSLLGTTIPEGSQSYAELLKRAELTQIWPGTGLSILHSTCCNTTTGMYYYCTFLFTFTHRRFTGAAHRDDPSGVTRAKCITDMSGTCVASQSVFDGACRGHSI